MPYKLTSKLKESRLPIGTRGLYNNVISIYLSLVSKGVNPLAALDLVNLKVAEKGWTGYATSAGGNLSIKFKSIPDDINGNLRGIISMTDTWDLMPGLRITRKINNKTDNLSNFFFEKGSLLEQTGTRLRDRGFGILSKPFYKAADISNKLLDKLWSFDMDNTSLGKWLNNTEVGKYVGGLPFTISYDFPVTKIGDKWKVGLETTPTPLDNKMYQFNKMTSWKL